MGPRREPRLAPARAAGHSGVQPLVRDLNQLYRTEPLARDRLRPGGFRWLEPDEGEERLAFLRRARRRGRMPSSSSRTSPRSPARLSGRTTRGGPYREAQHRRFGVRGLRGRKPGRDRRDRAAVARAAAVGRAAPAAARRRLARAGEVAKRRGSRSLRGAALNGATRARRGRSRSSSACGEDRGDDPAVLEVVDALVVAENAGVLVVAREHAGAAVLAPRDADAERPEARLAQSRRTRSRSSSPAGR